MSAVADEFLYAVATIARHGCVLSPVELRTLTGASDELVSEQLAALVKERIVRPAQLKDYPEPRAYQVTRAGADMLIGKRPQSTRPDLEQDDLVRGYLRAYLYVNGTAQGRDFAEDFDTVKDWLTEAHLPAPGHKAEARNAAEFCRENGRIYALHPMRPSLKLRSQIVNRLVNWRDVGDGVHHVFVVADQDVPAVSTILDSSGYVTTPIPAAPLDNFLADGMHKTRELSAGIYVNSEALFTSAELLGFPVYPGTAGTVLEMYKALLSLLGQTVPDAAQATYLFQHCRLYPLLYKAVASPFDLQEALAAIDSGSTIEGAALKVIRSKLKIYLSADLPDISRPWSRDILPGAGLGAPTFPKQHEGHTCPFTILFHNHYKGVSA